MSEAATLEHGRPGRYRAGCRCDLCHGNYLRRQKEYRLRSKVEYLDGNARPTIPQRVPAEPVRAHLRALISSGWTHTGVATEAGCAQGTVSDIFRGRFQRVHRTVAERLLTVAPLPDLSDYPDRVVVDQLLAGAHWRDIDARDADRTEAARRAYGRDGWWTWCDKALGLRSQRIKAIADEMAGVA